MVKDDVLGRVISVYRHEIRLTTRQWLHITEAHDYMSANLDKVLETIAEPSRIVIAERGETIALRDYESTNITRKTAVVIYRDEVDGFVITAFLTSKPHKIEQKGSIKWRKT
jgi:hypothetical protein